MWTHPLPPPDSGASFSSFGVFVFEIWVLRFRSRVLRFRDLEVFVFDRGCFVFEFWVLRFRDLGASCFGLRFRVLRFRNYPKRSPKIARCEVTHNLASHIALIYYIQDFRVYERTRDHTMPGPFPAKGKALGTRLLAVRKVILSKETSPIHRKMQNL